MFKFKNLTEYIVYLQKFFKLLIKYNIIIILTKIYLNCFNINLLSRRVDSLEIIIIKNKLKVINKIFYLNIFEDFKYYLNLIKYFRNSIHFYISLISSL